MFQITVRTKLPAFTKIINHFCFQITIINHKFLLTDHSTSFCTMDILFDFSSFAIYPMTSLCDGLNITSTESFFRCTHNLFKFLNTFLYYCKYNLYGFHDDCIIVIIIFSHKKETSNFATKVC